MIPDWLRNVLIVAGAAAIVAFLPQGDDTADFIANVLSILITIMFVWFGVWLYRSYRTDIYGLGERYRMLLYGSVAIVVLAMAGRHRLLDSGLGTLAWFALLISAVLGLYTVWRRHREYGL